MKENKPSNGFPPIVLEQIQQWLQSAQGIQLFKGLCDLLQEKPSSMVDLGQCLFWRRYQEYLMKNFSRRKNVGELKQLLRTAGLDCRSTSRGDWCGLAGRGSDYWADASMPVLKSPIIGTAKDGSWRRLGMDGSRPSEIRAEIFRAYVLCKYGSTGEENGLACEAFQKDSGMSFTEFFGGLVTREIKLEPWGETYCTWVSFRDGGISRMRVVPMRAHENNVFQKLSRPQMQALVEVAKEKIPEKIAFSELAKKFGTTRESVLCAYCHALGIAFSGDGRLVSAMSRSFAKIKDSYGHGSSRRVSSAVREYFIRLWRALIGRKGPARSRYLRKWESILTRANAQDAEVTLDDGKVIRGILLEYDDDYYTMRIGNGTELIEIAHILKIREVMRTTPTMKIADREDAGNSVDDPTFGDAEEGYVSWWGEDKGFGFVKAGQTSYYFERALVEDPTLLRALADGYRHQIVEFVVVRKAVGSYYARVKIVKVKRAGTLSGKERAQSPEKQGEQNRYWATCPEQDYVHYMLKEGCDFHGLECAGIRCVDDLPDNMDIEHDQKFSQLLSEHQRALTEFSTHAVDSESVKKYVGAKYNSEMLRYQLTGVCLLIGSGDEVKALTAWRIFLFRKLQQKFFESAPLCRDAAAAILVLMGRTLNRQELYWHTVIPALQVATFRRLDKTVMAQIIDDQDFRNAYLNSLAFDPVGDRELVDFIMSIGVDKEFSVLTNALAEWRPEIEVEDYAVFRTNVRERLMNGMKNFLPSELEDLAEYIARLSIPKVGNTDYRQGMIDVIKAAIKYARAGEYRELKQSYDGLKAKIGEFERIYVRDDAVLPVIDIYYPGVCEINRRAEADFEGKLYKHVKLRVQHASSSVYYVDDGEIEVRIRVSSSDRLSPSLCDVFVHVDGQSEDVYFAGPLHGGEGHVFSIPIDLTDEDVARRDCLLQGKITYRYLDVETVTAESKFELRYTVDEGEFELISNPYVNFVKKPATGRMFVGREKLLDEIKTVFQGDFGGQGYVLYGQRRSGKTSVYENVKGRLGDEGFVYTKISVQAFEESISLGSFARAIEDSVANMKEGGQFVPCESIAADDFLGRIRFMSRAIRKDGLTWVVGIDEFTTLYDRYCRAEEPERTRRKEVVGTFLRELKALLEERAFHLLVIGQESIVQMQKDFPNEFAILRLHRLSYLLENDVKMLADDPIAKRRNNGERVSRFKGKAFPRLFHLTAGQPWFTQMFCRTLVDYLNENRLHDISEDSVDRVEELLCVGDTKIADAEFEPFVNLMADVDEDEVVQLYYTIAKRTAEEFVWQPLSELSDSQRSLVRLLDDRGILKVRDEETCIRMGLFASWLRRNPGRTRASFGGKDF